jgi:hypothetical protein
MIKGIIPALAEGGKIKIGGLGEARTSKGGNTFRLPQKYDHFVVTKTTRDKTGDLEIDAALMAALPKDADGKCRAIPIVVHSDVIDEVFPTSYALYNGKKLVCRGDGETAMRQGVKRECPCDYLGAESGPNCKPHGTLHCSVMVPGQAVAGAVHMWRTTSIISIQRLIGSLQQILATCGTMRGLPLWLRLVPVQVSPKDKASTVYCCHVELRAADVMSVQRQALEALQMRKALGTGDIDAAYRALVQRPGENESQAEMADIDAEFHTVVEEPENPARDAAAEKLAECLTMEELQNVWLTVLSKEERALIGGAGLAAIKDEIANKEKAIA